LQIVDSVQFSEEDDAIIWQFSSSGKYSVQSLYAIINDRGVSHVYTRHVAVEGASRIHIFLCLLANNKTLTRDNLAKRRQVDDPTCVFCCELETVKHLFFECCVAQALWLELSEVLGLEVGNDFESLAKMWLSEKCFNMANVCTSAAM
jgi:hypothetical protein